MPKLIIKGIKWDTDGEKVEGLPTEVEVELSEVYPNMADDIAEWLSDRYGFCHEGFRYEFKK